MVDPEDIFAVIRRCIDAPGVIDAMQRAGSSSQQERCAWLDEAARLITDRITELR